MSGFSFRELTRADAEAIAGWRYAEQYSLYDGADPDELLRSDYEYYAATAEEGELVGFCCFGADARVAGLEGEPGTLDVGGGLRPDLTGIGLGGPFLREVCAFGGRLHEPLRFRVVIAEFNERAQMVASALGFERSDSLTVDGRPFVVMSRPA